MRGTRRWTVLRERERATRLNDQNARFTICALPHYLSFVLRGRGNFVVQSVEEEADRLWKQIQDLQKPHAAQ